MSPSAGPEVTVGLEQFAVTVGAVEPNLDVIEQRSRASFEAGAQIVCLPELAVSGYVLDPELARTVAESIEGPAVGRLTELAREYDGLIACGFCESDGDDLFNSVVLTGPEGPVLHYRKLHLFDREKALYTPGNLGLPVAETAFGTIGVCICYDLRFVEVMRVLALRGADIVLAPAAWVGGFDKRVPMTGATGHVSGVLAQANLDQVAVVAVSQVGSDDSTGSALLGGSTACDAYGEVLAGPLSRIAADSALARVDVAAGRAARRRSDTILPREDRRTDVYAVSYGGVQL